MLVKTYPAPSKKYGETVCCAAIDVATNRWVRVYPVNFRALDRDTQFRKWQFISASYTKARNDGRPESIHIHQDSIRVGDWLPAGRGWNRRRRYTDPLVVPSIEWLEAENTASGVSLGLIKPADIVDLTVEPTGERWEKESERDYRQLTITWEAEGLPASDLERLPYRFRYRFRCSDAACASHEMVILDWEIGQAFRNWRRQHGERGALARIRQKYLEELPQRELFLVVGTHHVYGNWMIVGVFAVPHADVAKQDRRAFGDRGGETASMTLPWVDLETQEGDPF